jgi:hypothetical protein
MTSVLLAHGEALLEAYALAAVVLLVFAVGTSIALIAALRQPARPGKRQALRRTLMALVLGAALSLTAYLAWGASLMIGRDR